MTTPTTGNPPAGWYADPSDPAMQRWYDGTGWTTHVQPVPTPAPAVPTPVVPTPVTPQYGYGATAAADTQYGYTAPAASPYGYTAPATSQYGYTAPTATPGWVQPVENHYLANPSGDLAAGKNTPARVALVVSILGMLGVPIAAIGGIVLSIVGLKRARSLEDVGWSPKGRGMARWALVLSCIGLVTSSLLVFNYVRSALDEATLAAPPSAPVVPSAPAAPAAPADPGSAQSTAIETEIVAGIAAQAGVTVTVECPSEIPTEAGAMFMCVATDTTGATSPVTVNVTDDAGGWTWQVG